jgi:phosphopantothenoylcysteine decarboxylase / phosphopantothenate---cysteine ligase
MRWGEAQAAEGAPGIEGGVRHIQASREADLIVVAPASANILGKVAHGIADDALSAAIMASSVPVLFAPAMNTLMWESAAVRENVALLRRRGFLFVQPGTGELACGDTGTGRMADPPEIAGEIFRLLGRRTGEKRRLLVTAGRTEEPVDPVRVLTNRSSGRMGFALAEAGRDLGYGVTLISGAVSVPPPHGVDLVRVGTAEEMAQAVRRHEAGHDIVVMAAAVADYRPRARVRDKIASGQKELRLALEPTTDILAGLKGRRSGKVTVGFALETGGDPLPRAREKLARKGCDVLVVNDPLRPGSEFGGATLEAGLLYPDGSYEPFGCRGKDEVAREILRRAAELLTAKEAARAPRPRGTAAVRPRAVKAGPKKGRK